MNKVTQRASVVGTMAMVAGFTWMALILDYPVPFATAVTVVIVIVMGYLLWRQ